MIKLNPKQKIVLKTIIDLLKWKCRYDEILFDGGSRSGKTFLICYLIILLCFLFELRILFCRSKLIDLKTTLLNQTFEPMLEKHFSGLWTSRTIDNSIIIYSIGKSEIWCSGLDNQNRSDKVLGSEYNIIYYNECLDIAPITRQKVKTRLSRKIDRFKNFTISDCNPGNPQHYVYKRFYQKIDEKGQSLADNLQLFVETFIPEDNIDNISEDYISQVLDTMTGSMKERFRYGRWANVEGQVYHNIKDDHIIDCNKYLLYYDDVIVGMDFGYYTAFDVIGIKDHKAYIIYDCKIIDGITADIIKQLDKIEHLRNFIIYADHEPDRINEISNAGYTIKNAYKEVGAGDSTVNSFEMFFDNETMNTFNCMQNIRRPMDKDGNFIDGKHVKENDHEADCVRYGVHSWAVDNNFNRDIKLSVPSGKVYEDDFDEDGYNNNEFVV
jgi:PBSX family phage terminase large subunit